jgi:hypothetical protein
MCIFRTPHDKKHPYVIINKEIFLSQFLTLKAKGLLGYLLSLPDDWKINSKHLAKVHGINVQTVYGILNELIAAGYVRKTEIKNAKGQFFLYTYEVSESPIFATLKESLPEGKNSLAENPSGEKPPITNKDIDILKNKDKDIYAPPSVTPPPEKISSSALPKKRKPAATSPELTETQKQALIAKYGADTTNLAISDLAEWKDSKRICEPAVVDKHTDYRRITKWVIPEIIKRQNAATQPFYGKAPVDRRTKDFQTGLPLSIEQYKKRFV